MRLAIKAAILTEGDPLNVHHWSGTPLSMVRALNRHLNLVHVERAPVSRFAVLIQRAVRRLTGGRVELGWSIPFVWASTIASRRRIRAARPDVLLVISSSPFVVITAREWPTVNISDATGPAMVGYYPEFMARPPNLREAIVKITVAAVRSALLSTYPSAWARDSAYVDCGAAPEAAIEIAWGPNFDMPQSGRIRTISTPARLLFVGFDWERKGGALATAAVHMLRADGHAVELDIVGCDRPEGEVDTQSIRFHGRLDKQVPEQAAKLDRLYEEAHLFILPTQAECYGMVFAEAASYGIPVISTATGGVPSVVQDGVTGILVPQGASAEALAGAVEQAIADPARYEAMSSAALDAAARRLNWDVWAEALAAAVALRLGRQQSR